MRTKEPWLFYFRKPEQAAGSQFHPPLVRQITTVEQIPKGVRREKSALLLLAVTLLAGWVSTMALADGTDPLPSCNPWGGCTNLG
jgi:hypothetical protein